jgi:hypothetical protein
VFAGDTAKYYRVSAVSETNTGNETALIRLTESVVTLRAIAEDEEGDVTINFSNVRLTGHDFLDIGTGGFALQTIQAVQVNLLTKKMKLQKQMVAVFTSHLLTKKVTLELVIYSELNRQLVLQLLTQTLLTFQVYQNYNLVLLVQN